MLLEAWSSSAGSEMLMIVMLESGGLVGRAARELSSWQSCSVALDMERSVDFGDNCSMFNAPAAGVPQNAGKGRSFTVQPLRTPPSPRGRLTHHSMILHSLHR